MGWDIFNARLKVSAGLAADFRDKIKQAADIQLNDQVNALAQAYEDQQVASDRLKNGH